MNPELINKVFHYYLICSVFAVLAIQALILIGKFQKDLSDDKINKIIEKRINESDDKGNHASLSDI